MSLLFFLQLNLSRHLSRQNPTPNPGDSRDNSDTYRVYNSPEFSTSRLLQQLAEIPRQSESDLNPLLYQL